MVSGTFIMMLSIAMDAQALLVVYEHKSDLYVDRVYFPGIGLHSLGSRTIHAQDK